MEPKKYQYIDSLRGIAILLVILGHVGNLLGSKINSFFPDFLTRFINNGHLGVQLFFVVSAFTLMLSYQNRKSEERATQKFFIRRYFRIAPMYYLGILYFTFQAFLGFDFSNLHWENLSIPNMVSNLLFIHGFIPSYINNYVPGGWSITVEFTFYFILPFLCTKITSLNRAIVFTLFSLLFSTFIQYILKGTYFDSNNYLDLFFFNQLPVFALGILAYWIITNKDDVIKTSTLAFLAFTVFIYIYIENVPYNFVYSLIYFLLILILSKKSYHVLSNKVLAHIGKVSFSMYIVHFVVMSNHNKWLFWLDINDTKSAYLSFIFTFGILFAVSYIISYFTYKYIEVSGQNLGRKLIKKLDQQFL